ncbi:AAA family ATPase [Psychrobacillus sp. FSL K6-2836]|uniref:AAA family ATPase n=1 Tax=Psychrobacillus sp. FSL K6-2836 TaxID=2921548 RepID=UPI0030F7D4C0
MSLKRIELQRDLIPSYNQYPFSIPSIANLHQLELHNKVTFFVGENGSGKSTLLEAIADKCEFNTAGGGKNNFYEVDASESALGDYIRLSWLPKVTNGFFLRAESFYNFASHIDQMGTGPYGGKSLHHQSHGEAFFSLFSNRFRGRGIYLLDEPEAALSPSRQLAFLRILHDLVQEDDSQFIIATHSPILLGYPYADILSFDQGEIKAIDYEETDHFQITKYFLQNREKFLQDIFAED